MSEFVQYFSACQYEGQQQPVFRGKELMESRQSLDEQVELERLPVSSAEQISRTHANTLGQANSHPRCRLSQCRTRSGFDTGETNTENVRPGRVKLLPSLSPPSLQ